MGSPEDLLRRIPPNWVFRYGPATDPIDMEFVIRDLEPSFRNKILAARLDTVAKVQSNMADIHRSIADGAENIARMLKAGK